MNNALPIYPVINFGEISENGYFPIFCKEHKKLVCENKISEQNLKDYKKADLYTSKKRKNSEDEEYKIWPKNQTKKIRSRKNDDKKLTIKMKSKGKESQYEVIEFIKKYEEFRKNQNLNIIIEFP